MIRDLINNNQIKDVAYPLKEDFAEVIEVNKDKTVNIKLTFRSGFYEKVPVLETYIPTKGEKGIVYFVGAGGQVLFQPLNPSIDMVKTIGVEGQVASYSLRKRGETGREGMTNLKDALKANPEYQKYLRSDSSRENSWGVTPWVNILLIGSKAFYEATGNILTVRDLQAEKGHSGIGHNTGEGADASSEPDSLEIVNNLNKNNASKVRGGLVALINAGVQAILWGLIHHPDQKLVKEVIKGIEDKMSINTPAPVGGSDAKAHVRHWHLSYRPREARL